MSYTREDAASVWHCWNQMEVYLQQMFTVVEQAEGKELVDQDGKVLLDANSSLWNVHIGHGNRRVIDAIGRQLSKLDFASLFLTSNGPAMDLAKQLFHLTGSRYQHVFYTNSGSEATDTAIKMARQFFYNQGEPGRYKVVSLEGAYHGSTLGALSACGIPDEKRAFGPLVPGFLQVPVPDPFLRPAGMALAEWARRSAGELESLIEQEGPETVAAFISEPVQGSRGVAVLPDFYWQDVRRLCDRHGILWISDEIATGFGRTGKMFAAEHSGFWPDIMLLAKGITSGYMPLGAVLVGRKIFDMFLGPVYSHREFVHGFTTSGHPVACAAALANLAVIEESGLVVNAMETGQYLLEGLESLRSFDVITDVQGKGLLLGIRLKDWVRQTPALVGWPPAMVVAAYMVKQGILVHPAGPNAVVLAPVLTFTRDDCDRVVRAFETTLTTLSRLW